MTGSPDNTATAVGLARVEEILKGLVASDQEATASRRELHKDVHQIKLDIQSISYRTESLEKQMVEASPTLREFTAIKNRVEGAGKLGKFLWVLGGIILSAATYLVGFFYGSK